MIKSITSLITAVTGVTVKLPAAYDVAGSYQYIADWSKVTPKPLFVAHKATEGNFYKDPYLKVDFAGMLANGIKRGAYHFFRKAINSLAQANYFCDYVRDTLSPDDFIVLDMEEGGETIAQIFAWLDGIEAQYLNEIIIYSNKGKIDDLVKQCTTAQLARLKSYKLWIAGYPFNPDAYNTIPASYIPAGFTVWAWQYASTGRIGGITNLKGVSTNVDLDWLSPEFIARLGTVTPPPTGETQMETWKVLADKLNIRSGSSTVYTVVQSVFKGDKIEGVLDVASQWIDVSKIIRVNGSVFTPTVPAKWWCSGSPLYVEKVIVTPPPPVAQEVIVTVTINETAKTHNTTVTWKDGTQS